MRECPRCSSQTHSMPDRRCHMTWQLRRHVYDSSDLVPVGGIYAGSPVWFEMN